MDAASGQHVPHVLPVSIAAAGTSTNRDSLGTMEAPAKPRRAALHPGSGPSGGPHVLPLPAGIAVAGTRTNRDSPGSMAAPAKPYRAAQPQRFLIYFNIGGDVMPAVRHRYGSVKNACTVVNGRQGGLPTWKAAPTPGETDGAPVGQA